MSGLDNIIFSITRDKPRDEETTKKFLNDIERGVYSNVVRTDGMYSPAIVALVANPKMLEFRLIDDKKTIIVHSPVGYFFQGYNAEKVCYDTNFVVGLLNACFNVESSENSQIVELVNVITSDNVKEMCNGPEVNKLVTPKLKTPSPFSLHGLGGGSKSRRTRRRKHRHNHKTHHKHARKTRHKRAHHSRSRSRAARKHKKYTYRRRK